MQRHRPHYLRNIAYVDPRHNVDVAPRLLDVYESIYEMQCQCDMNVEVFYGTLWMRILNVVET